MDSSLYGHRSSPMTSRSSEKNWGAAAVLGLRAEISDHRHELDQFYERLGRACQLKEGDLVPKVFYGVHISSPFAANSASFEACSVPM